MKAFLCALAAAFCLLCAPSAQAQFANRSIGIAAGYLDFNEGFALRPYSVPIGFIGSFYIENGWEFIWRVQLVISEYRPTATQHLGLAAPGLGFRYLLSEESFRPYLGGEVGADWFFGAGGIPVWAWADFAGIFGFEYFVNDAWSVGIRGQGGLLVTLNQQVEPYLGAQLTLQTYF
jgi:outer membrane protein